MYSLDALIRSDTGPPSRTTLVQSGSAFVHNCPKTLQAQGDLSALTGFPSKLVQDQVSKRAYFRGGQLATGGLISDVAVEAHVHGCTITGSCFTSVKRKIKHKVSAELGPKPGFLLKRSSCECTAGADSCSHVPGLLHHAASLVHQLHCTHSDDDKENVGQWPSAWKTRTWSHPCPPKKRKVDDAHCLGETKLSNVNEGSCFRKTTFDWPDQQPVTLRGNVDKDDRKNGLQQSCRNADQSMMLKTTRNADQSMMLKTTRNVDQSMMLLKTTRNLDLCSSSSEVRNNLCSPFSVKPLRLPERFLPLWVEQSQAALPPTYVEVQRWKAKFLKLLGSVDIDRIEMLTRDQSLSDVWFSERVCRLTASNVKKIVSRRRNMETLVDTLLYKQPPPYLPALYWGRVKEPEAVAMYQAKFPDRTLTKCGFHIDLANKFIGASPDRFVHDPLESEDGLLEVKCPFSTMDVPQVAAERKKGFCLKPTEGDICLDQHHRYYYQVMCQLACTKRPWCDFVVMCGNGLHVERIWYDDQFWQDCLVALKRFYMEHMLPALVYPSRLCTKG